MFRFGFLQDLYLQIKWSYSYNCINESFYNSPRWNIVKTTGQN